MTRIVPVAADDPRLSPLIEEAREQGFAFMDTLVREWADGTNRFDRAGECYLAVLSGGRVVAAGGLNRDPYSDAPGVGRIRHVYVLAEARRSGAGRILLAELANRARGHFGVLRLRTRTAGGAAFYEAIGYVRTAQGDATHIAEI